MISISARTVLVEGDRRGASEPVDSLTDLAADILRHWRPAVLAGAVAFGLALWSQWNALGTATAECLIRIPLDDAGDLRTIADAARVAGLAIAKPGPGDQGIAFSAKQDKGSDLIVINWPVRSSGEPAPTAAAEAIVGAVNDVLDPIMRQRRATIEAEIEGTDQTISDAKELIKGASESIGQSDAVALLVQQLGSLRQRRIVLEGRRDMETSARLVGKVRILPARFLALPTLLPPVAGTIAALATALAINAAAGIRSRADRGT